MSAPGEAMQLVCPHDGAVNRVPIERLDEQPRCGRCHQLLFDGEPVDLATAAFEKHLTHNQIPLLVDFWAAWCGPCQMMAPAYHEASLLLEPRVRVAKVDTEAEPTLAARFGIRSIPTLILFVGGREIARQNGALTVPGQIVRWTTSQLAQRGPKGSPV